MAKTINRAQQQRPVTEDEQLLESPRADEFRNTDTWRVFRIMGEFVEGFDELATLTRGVAVFGSARTPPDHPFYAAAEETAGLLVRAGFAVITGGGPGAMEAANCGARDAGALSIGLNIDLPFEQGFARGCVDRSLDFHYFFCRKVMFVRYANAFVVLPGGYGTLDELCEALCLIQTQKIRCFPVILIGTAYWSGLVDWLRERSLAEGKISPADLDLLHLTDDLDDVAERVVRAAAEQQV